MLFLVFCAVFQCLSCRVGGGGRWWVLGGWARWALSAGDWWAESTMHDSLPRIRRDACVALVGYYDLVCVRNASLRAFHFSVYFFLSVCSKRSFWLHKFVIFGFLFHVRCHTVIEVYRNARDGAHLGVCVCVLRQTTVTNAISISVPGIATDGGSPKSACFQSNAGGFAWHRSIKKNCVDFTLDGWRSKHSRFYILVTTAKCIRCAESESPMKHFFYFSRVWHNFSLLAGCFASILLVPRQCLEYAATTMLYYYYYIATNYRLYHDCVWSTGTFVCLWISG